MSRLQLQKIIIEGYKSFKSQNLALAEINVLIGQNGAGKSNFISLFQLLKNIIEGRLQNYSRKKGMQSLMYYGLQTDKVYVELNFSPYQYKVLLWPLLRDNALLVEADYAGLLDNSPNIENQRPWNLTTTSSYESSLPELSKKNAQTGEIYSFLKSCRVYHFYDTTETAGVKGYAFITDNRFLFEDAANLASFLYRMKLTGAAYYERIIKTIQLVMPFFKDFVLEPNFQNTETIRLEWQDRYSDKVFTAHDLSDGSLRFICMATLLLQETLPSVMLLDEPEIGLHPSAITILAGLLKKASKRTQVIVSTQSVSLVNEFDAEDIVVVERPAEETVMRRLDAEKLSAWLDEYSLGELWDKNVLGGKP